MPQPLALCIEDLSLPVPRFVRCVAVGGRQPGLRLGRDGEVQWKPPGTIGCELWVSADERLVLWRPSGAPEVQIHRAGRSLVAPCDKPVMLLDGDELTLGGRRLRLHVHGEAPTVTPPAPLPMRAGAATARAAAVLALGAAVVGCGRNIEVRENPPAVEPMRPDAGPDPAASGATTAPAATSDSGVLVPVTPPTASAPPIEVRDHPPEPALPPPPPPPASPPKQR
jgi:hypothetical protein